MHFDFIYFIQKNWLIIILLIGVGVIYFFLNKIFGNGKHENVDEDEEDGSIELREPKKEEKEENKHKVRTGYKTTSSSYYSEARPYDFVPKDGTSVIRNEGSRRKVVKPVQKNNLDEKEFAYKEVFYTKMYTNLNDVAKYMHLPNDQIIDDLKLYKKKGKFLDVSADLIKNTVTYANNILDRNEDVFYIEETEDTQEQEEYNGMIKHKCPYCGTDNILEKGQKKYNCYYCLQEVRC